MKAAVYKKFGGPSVVSIQEVPTPTPKPDEVLVRVAATTVSIADYRSRSKDLPEGLGFFGPLALGVFRPRHPILGMDFSGVIDAVGSEVTRFSPGDPVIGMTGSDFGAHAEYLTIAGDGLIAHAPTNLPLDDAAALIFGGVTLTLFYSLVPSLKGLRVLVNGASGATGTAAVQLAVAAGATVTGVSSAANHALVESLGATDMIDYTTTDFTTLGRQWDVIVDCVGNAPYSRVAPVVSKGGAVLLVVGSLRSMLSARRDSKRLGGVVALTTRKATASDVESVVSLAEAGAFVPTIDRRYAFDEIVAAHEFVGSWRKRGALLVSIR
jgi:NADPH:quinone reductase-like Zn-dependent oxidoreductase